MNSEQGTRQQGRESASNKLLDKKRRMDLKVIFMLIKSYQLAEKREADRALEMFEAKQQNTRTKNVQQTIIRNMSTSNHRKYYDYIIGKIRFQRDLELQRKQDFDPLKK